jgi:integrase
MAYTAMRWGEAVGFELSAFHGATINVMQQLNEFHGQWKRKPPKDGSYRYEDYDKGIIAVDLPPFLQTLLRDKAREMAGVKCGCDGAYTTQRPLCDGRSYLFLSPNRRHFRRSGYAGRFRPAADGLYQEQSRKEVVDPRRPVLVDATGTWPGRVLKPAWPPARPGEPFEPPFGRGRPRVTDGMALASWTPIKPGLTPHSWRHGHKTWLAELGLPEIYQAKRLGHSVSGLRGVYTHVTPETRATAVAALQARWEESLKARAEIDPHSASPLLDRLLQVVAARVLPECSQTAVGGRHLTLV